MHAEAVDLGANTGFQAVFPNNIAVDRFEWLEHRRFAEFCDASPATNTSVAVMARQGLVKLSFCLTLQPLGLFGGVGSLICATAPSMQITLAGRFVQGFGRGFLFALSYSIIRLTAVRATRSLPGLVTQRLKRGFKQNDG
jgi:MFS family permease